MNPRTVALACTAGILAVSAAAEDRGGILVAVVLAVMLSEGPEAVLPR